MTLRHHLASLALSGLALSGLAVGGLAAGAAAANATRVGNCPDATPVPGNADSLTVTAAAGRVITGYCVKSAGLRGTTGAPETVVLATSVTSLVLKHTDGGNLTHYSLITEPVQPATPTEPDEPTIEEPATDGDPSAHEPPIGEPPTQEFPTHEPPTEEPPTKEPTTETPPSSPNPPATSNGGFDWNWIYARPQCDGLVVAYPSNLPDGQSNDVNIRLETDRGQVTLNYHLDRGTWSGTTAFVYSQHPRWPAEVTDYTVTWTQVGGTNYHWQGAVECTLGQASPETGTRNGYPRSATETDTGTDTGTGTGTETGAGSGVVAPVQGYRSGTTTVTRKQRISDDVVLVSGLAGRSVELQLLRKGGWQQIATVTTSDGTAVVRYPQQRKRGTAAYRLVAGEWVSDVLIVTVR